MPGLYTESQPGLAQLFAQGLAGGAGQALGQAAGRGIGSLAGLGVEKLIGLGRPSKEQQSFWMSQGFSPEEAEQIASMPPQMQQEILKQAGGKKRAEALAPAYSQLLGGKPATAQSQPATQQGKEQDLIQMLVESGATEKDFQDLLKAQQEQKKISLAEEKGEIARHAATKDVMSGFVKENREASDGLHRIERLRELEKEGLAGPGEVKLKEGLGDIPYFGKFMGGLQTLDPASQEFKSLQKDFMRDLKSIFGGRISNIELEQFMQSIPTLMNTPEGRERIYKNLEYAYKAKKLRFEEARKIKKENNNRVPLDIEEQVEDRMEKKLNKLAKQIRIGSEAGSPTIKKIGEREVMLAKGLPDGKTATNKVTGAKMIVRNGKWEPYEIS